MKDLARSVRLKWRWACEKPHYWVSLLLATATVSVICFWPGPSVLGVLSDTRVRIWALVLQLVGTWTVWHDLTSTARNAGHPGPLQNFSEWIRAFRFGRAHALLAGTGKYGLKGSTARLEKRFSPNDSMPLEERLHAIEYNLAEISNDLGNAFQAIDKATSEMRAEISGEVSKREDALRDLHEKIKDMAMGNFPTLAFGIAWLTVGTVLSALAPEIVRIAAGQWETVWKAL